jgi:carbonic anhydrase
MSTRRSTCRPFRRSPGLGAACAALAALLAATAPVAAETVASVDPMAHLKARLQEKLGATRIQEAQAGTHELQVPARAEAPVRTARARPQADDLEALVQAHRAARADIAWGYQGEGAPAHWGTLRPEFALCGNGQRQSPIDIRDGIAVELEPIRFDYRPTGFAVTDNGHTVQVDVGPGNSIEVMGRRYDLKHIQFRRPSEERINGRQFEMSVHLVHQDPDGRHAVVGVVLERGVAQPVVQQVWNNLPLEKHEPLAAQEPMDPAALLPEDRRYFTYMGSLTTPPCSEGVLWMVMQQPVQASPEQIHIFSRLYPNNARPIQQAAGRLIKQSQ